MSVLPKVKKNQLIVTGYIYYLICIYESPIHDSPRLLLNGLGFDGQCYFFSVLFLFFFHFHCYLFSQCQKTERDVFVVANFFVSTVICGLVTASTPDSHVRNISFPILISLKSTRIFLTVVTEFVNTVMLIKLILFIYSDIRSLFYITK